MRNSVIAVIAGSLLVAGCSQGTEDAGGGEAIGTEELAERASDIVRPDPGLYRSTVELLEVDMPGAPAGMEDTMKRAMGGANSTTEYCLTSEDAERGFEEMAKNSQKGDCSFERFEADGGKIDAAMTCRGGEGGEGAVMQMTMQGTGGRTASEMTMTMQTEAPGMGKATMRMKATHQRIGDCPG